MAEEERPTKAREEDLTLRRVYVSRAHGNRAKFVVVGVKEAAGRVHDTREEALDLAEKYREKIRKGGWSWDDRRGGYEKDDAEETDPTQADHELIEGAAELVQEYYVGKGMEEDDALGAAREKIAEFLTRTNRTYRNPRTLADRVVEMIETPPENTDEGPSRPPEGGDETSR